MAKENFIASRIAAFKCADDKKKFIYGDTSRVTIVTDWVSFAGRVSARHVGLKPHLQLVQLRFLGLRLR